MTVQTFLVQKAQWNVSEGLSLFFFQNTQKNVKLYLVLAVGPVLES